jgi:threonyl-tRNA synthetase
MPVWLAPIQAVVATITSEANDYGEQVKDRLKAAGIRVQSDFRNEKINYKVREHSLAKVPHLLVLGRREEQEGTVAMRILGNKEQRVMSLEEAISMLEQKVSAPDQVSS